MDELYFGDDDFFIPISDDESIWQLVDPIIIEKNEPLIGTHNNNNKRAISDISNTNIFEHNDFFSTNGFNKSNPSSTTSKKPKAENNEELPTIISNKDELVFFSNPKNPFAQTSWMVLLEKKIPFKYFEVK